jgi:ORF 12 gene product N-terminal
VKFGSQERRPGRPAWPFRVALSTTVVLLAGACGSPGAAGPAGPAATAAPATAVVPPGTPAGVQLRWLIAAMAHLPLSAAQVRAHVDAAFWAQVSPAMLNQALQALVSLRVLAIGVSELNTVVADVSTGSGLRAQVLLTVDRRGLISWLRISPDLAGPAPATWAGVDAAVQSAAPQARTPGWATSATSLQVGRILRDGRGQGSSRSATGIRER